MKKDTRQQEPGALTWADSRHLEMCPDKGWFSWTNVIFIGRPDYSLGRLVDKGYLEMRVKEGQREYRRIKQEPATAEKPCEHKRWRDRIGLGGGMNRVCDDCGETLGRH